MVDAITPVPRRAGDHAAAAVHAHLRALILRGAFPPGAQLNQVELAPLLGVSRTPLREAIRMLQEEGLVEAQPQKRARIVGFDPGHLEAVYVQRIVLESLGAEMTVPRMTDEQLVELRGLLTRMRTLAEAREDTPWRATHQRFHEALVSGAGTHLQRAIVNHMDRSEHYRLMSMYRETSPRAWLTPDAEHERIVDAYERRDPEAAAAELAAHLARTALSLMAHLAPAHDPAAIRTALAIYHAEPASLAANGAAEARAAAVS